jgi:hypothetical protein
MQERLDSLLKTAGDAGSALSLPHNEPDPGAIASAVAWRHLLARTLDGESPSACQAALAGPQQGRGATINMTGKIVPRKLLKPECWGILGHRQRRFYIGGRRSVVNS